MRLRIQGTLSKMGHISIMLHGRLWNVGINVSDEVRGNL